MDVFQSRGMSGARMRMMPWLLVFTLVLGSPGATCARTIVVAADGSGEFRLVSEAIAAAVSGDTLLIQPGEYDEYDGDEYSLQVNDKVLFFRGGGSVASETSLRLSMLFHRCTVTLENLRFHHECTPIRCYGGVGERYSLSVKHCLFDGNYGNPLQAYSGAIVAKSGMTTLIEDCDFIQNRAEGQDGRGGAVYVGRNSIIRNCRFIENGSSEEGGALWALGPIELTNCIFLRNWSADAAAFAIVSGAIISNCTIYENRLTGAPGSAIKNLGYWEAPISHCIIAGTINGYAALCIGAVFECSDEWDNEYGIGDPWCWFTPEDGNFHEDPLLCNPDANDVRLQAASPCWPGVHGGKECGLIGASSVVCGDVPTEPVTWGRLKSLFRW